MQIGKPKDAQSKVHFKIKDGDNVYRILPPLGALAEAGKWRAYYEVQWGFRGVSGKSRPFQDCRVVNWKTKMVEVESNAYLFRQQLKRRRDELINALREGKANKDDVQSVVDELRQYNLDAKHYLNVVNLNGEIGLLKINNKFKNALEDQIKTYKERYNQHPIFMGEKGMGGVYFNFYRSNSTGKITDYVFQVTPYKEVINDQGDERTKVHVMDESFISRLKEEAFDLSTLFVSPSAEDVSVLVENRNNPAMVDEIMNKYKKNSSNSSSSLHETVKSVEVKQVSDTPTPSTATLTEEVGGVTEEVAVASSVTEKTETVEEPKAQVKETSEMSDEEFLKSIGAV